MARHAAPETTSELDPPTDEFAAVNELSNRVYGPTSTPTPFMSRIPWSMIFHYTKVYAVAIKRMLIFLVIFVLGMLASRNSEATSGSTTTVPGSHPVTQACSLVDWKNLPGDFNTPYDANQDGFIDCESDIELGA